MSRTHPPALIVGLEAHLVSPFPTVPPSSQPWPFPLQSHLHPLESVSPRIFPAPLSSKTLAHPTLVQLKSGGSPSPSLLVPWLHPRPERQT